VSWLPSGLEPPARLDLPTGHHLRPIRAGDVEIDYPAVMGSLASLREKYGEAWGWPPETMTYAQDREDLAHHEAEMAARESFNYAVLDAGETELLGCVYVDPPYADPPPGTDAVVSWWLVDRMGGSDLERALADAVPAWLHDTWGFHAVHLWP
jgi:RimJ/RimL family protein N-acetyltransferase